MRAGYAELHRKAGTLNTSVPSVCEPLEGVVEQKEGVNA